MESGAFNTGGDWNHSSPSTNLLTRQIDAICRKRRGGHVTPMDAVALIYGADIVAAFHPADLEQWATLKGWDGSRGTWLWPLARCSNSAAQSIKDAGYAYRGFPNAPDDKHHEAHERATKERENWLDQRKKDAHDAPDPEASKLALGAVHGVSFARLSED